MSTACVQIFIRYSADIISLGCDPVSFVERMPEILGHFSFTADPSGRSFVRTEGSNYPGNMVYVSCAY